MGVDGHLQPWMGESSLMFVLLACFADYRLDGSHDEAVLASSPKLSSSCSSIPSSCFVMTPFPTPTGCVYEARNFELNEEIRYEFELGQGVSERGLRCSQLPW